MKKYGRRPRRKLRLIKGWTVYPLPMEKALGFFSKTKQGVIDKLFVLSGKTPEQLGVKVARCELSLRTFPDGRKII